ncbi:MAG: VCBS repeat-containing protein [Planctomycetes bacterium]|nr:VCBS repeat-containing protein [Planctomycetota bacterium]
MAQSSRNNLILAALAAAAALAGFFWYINNRPAAPDDPGAGNKSESATSALSRHRILASVHYINSRLEDPKHREEVVRAVDEAAECLRLAGDSPVDSLNYAICVLRQYDERRFEINKTENGANPPLTVDWIQLAKPLLAKAETLLDAVAKAQPGLAAAHFHAAMTAVRRGKLEADQESSDWKIKFRAAAEHYLKLEDRSASIRYHSGFLNFKDGKYAEAEKSLRRAIELDPNHPNAYYSLGQSIARQGDHNKDAEVERIFARHRDLQETIGKARAQWDPDAVYDAVFPELVAIDSGATAAVVDDATHFEAAVAAGNVAFALPILRGDAMSLPGALAQGGRAEEAARLSLLTVATDGAATFINIRDRSVVAVGEKAPAGLKTWPLAAVAADFDGDHSLDILASDGNGLVLYQSEGLTAANGYRESTPPGLENTGGIVSFFVADLDSDGDLDIVAIQRTQQFTGVRVFRNDSEPVAAPEETPAENLTFRPKFTDISDICKLSLEGTGPMMVLPLDYDNGNDVDVLVVYNDHSTLFANRRGFKFERVGELPGAISAAAGDVDGDGFTDLVLAGPDGASFIRNNGRTLEAPISLIKGPIQSPRVAIADITNRGQADIVCFAENRASVFRYLGGGAFADVGSQLFPDGYRGKPSNIVITDLDGDFDLDVVVTSPSGKCAYYINRGSEKRPAVAIAFRGTKTNRAGLGAKIEARAGGMRIRKEVWSLPAYVAVGANPRIDGLFIKWSNGIDEAEGGVPAGRYKSYIEKRGREGSCPFVYSWNGERFVFVTDAIGATPLGLYAAPGIWVPPQDREWLRITDSQLKPKDGQYILHFTEEMRELTYLDRVRLVCIDHPEGTSIYPNERFSFPPFAEKKILRVAKEIPVRSAKNSRGEDVTSLLLKEDHEFVKPPERIGYQGMCTDHSLELDLGEITDYDHLRLFLTGWFAWTNSSINRAIADAGIRFSPPRVDVRDGDSWRTVVEDAGFPAGMQKTMCVDLGGKLKSGEHVIRIHTNIALYWDRAFISYDADDASVAAAPFAFRSTEIAPTEATLSSRGASKWSIVGGNWPSEPVYEQCVPELVYDIHTGDYTKYGDVRALLDADDDQFVIFHHGDDLKLVFDASLAPKLAPGMTRTFLLDSSGWAKDMDPNTFAPSTVYPLPFHGMSGYPYAEKEHYPDDAAHLNYQKTWNTRIAIDRRTLPIQSGIEAIHKN